MKFYKYPYGICFFTAVCCLILGISGCSTTKKPDSKTTSQGDSKYASGVSAETSGDPAESSNLSAVTSTTDSSSDIQKSENSSVALDSGKTGSGSETGKSSTSIPSSSVKSSVPSTESSAVTPGDELKGELTDGIEYTFMNYDTGRWLGTGTTKSFTLKKSGTGYQLMDKTSGKYVNASGDALSLAASGTVCTIKHIQNGLYTMDAGSGKYLRDNDSGTTNFAVTTTIADKGQVSAQWYITQKSKKQPLRILPMGDSITEGCDADISPQDYEGYRYKLWKSLNQAGLRFVYVGSIAGNRISEEGLFRNEGHGGWTIDGTNGIANITDRVMTKYDPDMILLQIGTNDCYFAAGTYGSNMSSLGTISDKLENLLKKIFRKKPTGCTVFLAQITPDMQGDVRNNWNIAYNGSMPGMVSRLSSSGKSILLVDNYSPLMALGKSLNYGLSKDSLHPCGTGYTEMAKTWSAAILKKYK